MNSQGTGSTEARAQAVTTVRDREAELAVIRSEMAATRIAAAKKEAELQELRSLVNQLRQENAESHQALRDLRQANEARQTELVALRSERDQLLQAKSEQQFKSLTDSLLALTKELEEVKQGLAQTVTKSTTKQGKVSSAKPIRPGSKDPHPDQPGLLPSSLRDSLLPPTVEPAVRVISEQVPSSPPLRITVEPGDTLTRLARQYKTTVEAIKQANRLETDQLVVGQRLLIPDTVTPDR
ncbi:MAG: LysM peptidoglycan-binding domain-containing protein [Nitrospiraceae bacterium]